MLLFLFLPFLFPLFLTQLISCGLFLLFSVYMHSLQLQRHIIALDWLLWVSPYQEMLERGRITMQQIYRLKITFEITLNMLHECLMVRVILY